MLDYCVIIINIKSIVISLVSLSIILLDVTEYIRIHIKSAIVIQIDQQ